MIIDPIIGTLAVLVFLFVIRINLVASHRDFVIKLMKAVGEEYLNMSYKKAEREEPNVPEEDKPKFYENAKAEMARVHNITKMFQMYPSIFTLIFDLRKWTREQMYPYLDLNMALAISDKLEDIDKDLINS